MWCKKQLVWVLLVTVGSVLSRLSLGHAGQLVLPLVGPQDASLSGNAVALPLNPASALFHNPAQLTLLPDSATFGLLAARFEFKYANLQTGYDNTSRELPLAPSLGYVHRFGRFSVGIGLYGAIGFTYNLEPEPEHGIPNNLYTELGVMSLAPAIAYSLTPNLHLGFEINPSYGRSRLKAPSPFGRLDVDMRGPGVFGMVGLFYTPTPKLSLGIGYKTPGVIWMRGNARIGGQGDDAHLDFQLPQNLAFGLAYRVTDRLAVTVQGRWVEFSAFEDSRVEFDEHTELNQAAAQDAWDRFRWGGGVQYVLLPGVTVHLGFSWEQWAIEVASLSPTLPDLTEYLFGFGVNVQRGLWDIHLSGNYAYVESRRVSPARNPFFSGHYEINPFIIGLQVTRRFE